MGLGKKWVGISVAGIVMLGLAGCGESANASTAAPAAAAASDTSGSSDHSSYGTNSITLLAYPGIISMSGVDKDMHDAILPSSWVVKQGQLFTVTVINYDGAPHTITAPDLGLDFQIKAGIEDATTKTVTPVTSTFTFTATKTGDFHWFCNLPCDDLGMQDAGNNGKGYDGIMAGEIVVQA